MEKNNETQSKLVETYAEDMAKVIEGDKSGLIKKIISGAEEQEKERNNISPESKKNKFFIFAGFLCIALSIVTFVYFFTKNQTPAVPVMQQFTPLVFTDKSSFVAVDALKKEEIAQTVSNAVHTTDVKEGGIEGMYLTFNKKVVGLRQFITLIQGNFTPNKDTSIIGDNFLMGGMNGETKDFFMLLKMRSTADIFDSLHTWESKMFYDLHGFFAVALTPDTNYLLSAPFVDGIVNNKNARVLYDKNKKIVMMYIFADDNSVIITDTTNTGGEIISRLSSNQIKN